MADVLSFVGDSYQWDFSFVRPVRPGLGNKVDFVLYGSNLFWAEWIGFVGLPPLKMSLRLSPIMEC